MSRRGRGLVFLPIGAVLLFVLLVAVAGLPDFGHGDSAYGEYVEAHVPGRSGATNIVAGVTFDVRAFDTLGEEFILFAAATACVMLLRRLRSEEDEPAVALDDVTASEAAPIRALGAGLVAPLVVLGAYVVAHGHVTPGGGFQGGVVLAALMLLVFATGRIAAARRLPTVGVSEAAEAFGAGAFVVIAIGGLLFGAAALANFLDPGTSGDLISAGTVPLLNIAVGLEVAAAFVLIVVELLDELLPGSASE